MDSIILNSNNDLYGNEPFKFVNHFSENIKIKPNQSIALYSASIEKPIISFSEDQLAQIGIRLNNDIPSRNFVYTINTFTNVFEDEPVINIKIPKGNYTGFELLKIMESNGNDGLDEFLKTASRDVEQYLENSTYKFSARFIEGKPSLIFDNYYPTQTFNMITDLDQRNNVLFGIESNIGDIFPDVLSNVGDIQEWDTWGCSYDTMNPINGLFNFNTGGNIRKSSIYFELDHNLESEGEYFFTFNNLKYIKSWKDIDEPTLMKTSDDRELPMGWIGVRFSFTDEGSKYGCEIALYENNLLTQEQSLRDDLLQRWNCVFKTQIEDIGNDPTFFINNVFGFTFYQKNDVNLNDYTNMNTYYKFHTTYTNINLLNNYDDGVLYDSAQNGRIIHPNIIANTIKLFDPNNPSNPNIETIPYEDMTTQGLQPFFFFNNLKLATGFPYQYGFKKVRGNKIKVGKNDGGSTAQRTDPLFIYSYNFNILTDELRNVFSFSQKRRICPVYLNIEKVDYETIISDTLYEENKSYNIIIKNLPLRTSYAQGQGQNIGFKDNIIYNFNGIFKNEIANPSTNIISRTTYPNQLKFLSCKNTQDLNLNKLEVEIRNTKTGELAKEILNVSLELVIN